MGTAPEVADHWNPSVHARYQGLLRAEFNFAIPLVVKESYPVPHMHFTDPFMVLITSDIQVARLKL